MALISSSTQADSSKSCGDSIPNTGLESSPAIDKQFVYLSTARNSYQFSIIKFYYDNIQTTVTKSATVVDRWIDDILYIHRHRLHKFLVGLDTEWRPREHHDEYQPVAIIQLCVGRRCLIFQLYHADAIPQSLINFLANQNFTFVGVNVKGDAIKLFHDYGLCVSHFMDVAYATAQKYHDKDYKRIGLRMLGFEFLGVWMQKPKHITMSNWDNEKLTDAQVEYACIDAFVSFKLGIEVKKPRYRSKEARF